jgi:hypothetical protein
MHIAEKQEIRAKFTSMRPPISKSVACFSSLELGEMALVAARRREASSAPLVLGEKPTPEIRSTLDLCRPYVIGWEKERTRRLDVCGPGDLGCSNPRRWRALGLSVVQALKKKCWVGLDQAPSDEPASSVGQKLVVVNC